ncbi:hypothetical protein DVU_0008 [Nitratidesulfovibrio vulgaris str. Hildenborough]|uniref:Uncharacterized protein n=1 Tax=Nitratidesulfovibrio vulgaris (strain ATCC 29579 / DSM 644 / CCUG 34227 / NCIMB 8303 / VKM B-1760 / Hildenborough) TaxID=882 RepID=Q72G52_NITV2|nr:hypothetical protein DVU_0008 [Nitratidesulfovibrio vulgaris str. Hildenborough]
MALMRTASPSNRHASLMCHYVEARMRTHVHITSNIMIINIL